MTRAWNAPMVAIVVGTLTLACSAGTREPAPGEIDALIADLMDDDVRSNAIRATRWLTGFGHQAVPALEHALTSPDWQQRQLAAHVLRRIAGYVPSRLMLDVTVEGLRVDGLPRETLPGRRWPTDSNIRNAHDGVRFLLAHAEPAEPFLLRGLRSGDEQQQFLCAFVLGSTGRTKGLARAAPILLPHLRHNAVPNDAIMAASALYHFGDGVLPYLAEALPLADTQQEQLLRLIMLDLTDPPETIDEVIERRSMHTISRMYDDPLLEFEYGRKHWFGEDRRAGR